MSPTGLFRLTELAQRAGLSPPTVHQGPALGFRHRARLAVRGRANNPKIGIFEEGSHRVVHIPKCLVHHPLVNRVSTTLRETMVALGLSPYSDGAHRGRVRYLQVVVERPSQTAQVVVVTNDAAPSGLEPLFDALADRLGPSLHSLFWNGNPSPENTILGPSMARVSGPETTVETVLGTRIFYPPGAFGQSNLDLAERLAQRIAALIPPGSRILELYAGVGALGLPLARDAASLTLNELTEASLDGMRRGVGELGPVSERVQVLPGPATEAAPAIAQADVVLTDPPRRGLDREVLDRLLASPPARLISLSCGLDAFLREADELLGSGRYRLSELEAFALFPFTAHLETLGVFERLTGAHQA